MTKIKADLKKPINKLVASFNFIPVISVFACMVSSVQAQTIRYVHTDGLGSVSAITDADRNIIERREYEPYGASLSAPTDGIGYTGHLVDATTGLIYMQQRYYDPILGVFLSVDQIAASTNNGTGFNRYNYAANNPYAFTDPDGRAPSGQILYGPGGRQAGQVSAPSSTIEASGDESNQDDRRRRGAGVDIGKMYPLPQNQGEGGFYNYGTPSNGAGQWGTGAALSAIFAAGHLWGLRGEESFFGVGNMSLKNGGTFPPHSSHRNGLDIDVRPMSIGGARNSVTWQSPSYDRAATQRLVDTFYSTGYVQQIFFNDPKINGVKPLAGHDNHLHIRVNP
ncbi:RHS repeat-associated core domain-containing protein [Xanthomonas arboricola]|uniref:RHS repeat-associated core domain-containing protein n=1 Tax=Xanthomonas arboricola TaxID=56448 RepID=UPI000C85DF51|nr:RHS repeat-associated core domain-containing protein [Xanthomonas arboricola]SOT98326.1 Rhs family protein [Xanthomonas arboricola pv. fragariae]